MDNSICPLNLNFCEGDGCVNEESCFHWTAPQALYEIIFLEGLPGALYLPEDHNYVWTEEQWGFVRLSSLDFLLYHTASCNNFVVWKKAYYALTARWKYGVYVRLEKAAEFEQLRRQCDREYGQFEEDWESGKIKSIFGDCDF